MGGGSIKKPTQKRSINFTTETLETLDKLAAKNHTTTSELVRGYVEKGLSIEGSREDIDFIARRSEERRVGKECRSRWSPYH